MHIAPQAGGLGGVLSVSSSVRWASPWLGGSGPAWRLVRRPQVLGEALPVLSEQCCGGGEQRKLTKGLPASSEALWRVNPHGPAHRAGDVPPQEVTLGVPVRV